MEALKKRQSEDKKTKITDFFNKQTESGAQQIDPVKHLQNLADAARNKFNSNKGTLNERLTQGIQAGNYWVESQQTKMEQIVGSSEKVVQDHEHKHILLDVT